MFIAAEHFSRALAACGEEYLTFQVGFGKYNFNA